MALKKAAINNGSSAYWIGEVACFNVEIARHVSCLMMASQNGSWNQQRLQINMYKGQGLNTII